MDSFLVTLIDLFCVQRQYEEFKVQINGLVEKFQNTPRDCWIMTDGNPWPGTDSQNHPGILQVFYFFLFDFLACANCMHKYK